MQIHRLFELVYILLERENVTARELADRFEVSTRTIYRDLETLSGAGVPVYATRGRAGGIRILPGYVLDRSVLTDSEQSQILSALQGMRAMRPEESSSVLGKVSSLFRRSNPSWISVDFSRWGSGQREMFEVIRGAIMEHQVIHFTYYGANGEKSQRLVEPWQLCFKGQTWYLRGLCREKQQMRLFRLTRMKQVELAGVKFGEIPLEPLEQDIEQTDWSPSGPIIEIRLRINAALAFRVYDEFEPEGIQCNPDGSFEVTTRSPIDSWIVGYILSFGADVQVLDPPELQEAIIQEAKKILSVY